MLTLGQTVMESFGLMGEVVNIAAEFLSIAHIQYLMSIIVVLNAVFSFIAWSPIVIAIFEFLILLCQKVIIPGIIIALILDFCTRFIGEMSFSKASDLIRGTVMTLITASLLLIWSHFYLLQELPFLP